jgi:hypothetical protein
MTHLFDKKIVLYLLWGGIILSGLLACTSRPYPTDVFIPPTRLPTQPPPTPDPTTPAIPSAAPSTPTPPCTANLLFLSDLTIPDGTQVQPNEALDKRWRVQNNGDCNWDESYRLKLVSGPSLGAVEEQMLYPARAGSEAIIRILFVAPGEPGEYRSAWQAYTPDNQPYGDLIYMAILIP